jgi:hypothetical protein
VATIATPFATAEVFGIAPIGAGDVNSDGYAEVMLSGNATADNYSHRIFVFYGAGSGTSSSVGSVLGVPHDDEKTQFGGTKVGVDVNGDGYWDIAVGAPWIDTAYVFMGGPAGANTSADATLTNGLTGSQFGYALSAGDHNGDTYEDLGVDAYYENQVGSMRVFYGAASGISPTPGTKIDSPNGGTFFGIFLKSAGGGA